MALVLADRVKVRARTTGTGTFTLESTAEGYQGFDAVGNGNDTYYGIVDAHGNWEIGRGTYTASGTTLSRDTVVSSSNNDALVNFPAGGKNVFCTFPSSIALALISGGGLDLSAVGQNILPAIDSNGTTGYTLGSSAFKWKELFVSNGSIYIGDVKLSNVAGKLAVTKVINPGEDDEEDDPEDSEADSEIKSLNRLVNDEHEFKLESDGTLTLNGDPFTGGSGSGVDGLTGDTSYEPDSEGDTNYSLSINGDIELKTYDDGSTSFGPGISLGYQSGGSLSSGVIAIGNNDTGYKGKRGGVYIGYQAGWNAEEDPQGEYAIAIGAKAARNIALDNSITLNATGVALDPTEAGLFIKPVRQDTGNTAKAVYYNTTTGELTYANPTGGSGSTGNVQFDSNTLYVENESQFYSGFLNLQNNENEVVLGSDTAAPVRIGIYEDGNFNEWIFDSTGGLTFPDNTVQTTAYTGGGSTSYTPDDTDNWEDPAVNTIAAALDELAARVTALQNFEIDGGNAYTPPEGELLIDGNGA